VVQLQKELLLMGEAHERLQNHLQQQQRVGQENSRLASEMIILSLKAEIKGEWEQIPFLHLQNTVSPHKKMCTTLWENIHCLLLLPFSSFLPTQAQF
jgi:hypothetical protein